jgi:hypothetical protein
VVVTGKCMRGETEQQHGDAKRRKVCTHRVVERVRVGELRLLEPPQRVRQRRAVAPGTGVANVAVSCVDESWWFW